jgi:hypothetical protein
MSCRRGEDFRRSWGSPAMMALEGGSFGFEIGGEATDFVLLVMNERGASGIFTSKVKLGADASLAAEPVGRTASAKTDATLRADILSYSHGSHSKDQPFVPTMAPINRLTDRRSRQERSACQRVWPSRQPLREWFRHWILGLRGISPDPGRKPDWQRHGEAFG